MKLEANREDLCINRIVAEKNENFWAEGDVIVPDVKPDILNVISTNGNVCVYKKEVMDGKIKLDGNVGIYVMYFPDSQKDEIRSLHTTIEFSRIIEMNNIKSGMSINEIMNIREIECKILNGRKLNIKCEISTSVKVFSNENISIIKKINNDDNIQTLVSNINVNSLIGMGEVKVIGKENIRIDKGDNIGEILNASINIGGQDVKISYNKVITKAEAEVRVLYLTEDNRINSVETKIPLMGFVDVQNVSEDNLCETNYSFKNIDIKINSDEEHSIFVELEVHVMCRVYGNNHVELMQDLYSRKNKIEFSKKQVEAIACKRKLQDVCNIREKISIPELTNAEIYDAIVTPTVKLQDVMNEQIIYQGNINIKFLYSLGKEVGMKEYDMPYAFRVKCSDIDKSFNIEENIEMPLHDFVIMQEGTIETKIDLMFNILISKNANINILENIEVEDEEENNNYSMTIYFVKPKDTLWEIAKRFRSTVADIVNVNEIENENNIQIGQQLFIPR